MGVAADAATSARGGSASAVGEIDKSIQLSCGEHTDYGLLTLVNQDPGITALQVCLGILLNTVDVLPTFDDTISTLHSYANAGKPILHCGQ